MRRRQQRHILWLVGLLFVVLLAAGYCGVSNAATYYIDPAGDASAPYDCSVGNPCRDMEDALDKVGAGDTINVNSGTYTTGHEAYTENAACQPSLYTLADVFIAVDDPVNHAGITIQMTPGDPSTPYFTGADVGFEIDGVDNVTISGIELEPDANASCITSSDNFVVKDYILHPTPIDGGAAQILSTVYLSDGGLFLRGEEYLGSQSDTAEQLCDAYDASGSGAYFRALRGVTNLTYDGMYWHHISSWGYIHDSDRTSGVYGSPSTDVTIKNSRIIHMNEHGVYVQGGTTRLLIENTIFDGDPACTGGSGTDWNQCRNDSCYCGTCTATPDCLSSCYRGHRTVDLLECIDCTFRNNLFAGRGYTNTGSVLGLNSTGIARTSGDQCIDGADCQITGLTFVNNLIYASGPEGKMMKWKAGNTSWTGAVIDYNFYGLPGDSFGFDHNGVIYDPDADGFASWQGVVIDEVSASPDANGALYVTPSDEWFVNYSVGMSVDNYAPGPGAADYLNAGSTAAGHCASEDIYGATRPGGVCNPGPYISPDSELQPTVGLIGSDIQRSNGGDFPVRFTRPKNYQMTTAAQRAQLGRNHDQTSLTGGGQQLWGCTDGTALNPYLWCNSHGNRRFENSSMYHVNRSGRCAGDYREACWRTAVGTDPAGGVDRCDALGLGDCDVSYWPYYLKTQRGFWARDPHGHKVPIYGTARNNPSCNYENGGGYCAAGPLTGEGCTGDRDCGWIPSSGRCGGMCSAGSSDPGMECSSDGDCSGGTCDVPAVTAAAYPELSDAGAPCANYDGSECQVGHCEMRSYYNCGNHTNAGDWIPNPTTHPVNNVTMNYAGLESATTTCDNLFNLEDGSTATSWYAAMAADVVEPWPGEWPVAGDVGWVRGNELGGPSSGRANEAGGGVVVHFTDNSNVSPHMSAHYTGPRIRRCNVSNDICTNNASCPIGQVCSAQFSSETWVRSAYDTSQQASWSERAEQAMRFDATVTEATHANRGISYGATAASQIYKVPATCESWAGYSGKRCDFSGYNTEYWCVTDLDCERMNVDINLKNLAGGFYCNRSLRPCPTQTECLGEDGSCEWYEGWDGTEMESGSVQRGVSCYDAETGTGCPDNNWLRGNRDSNTAGWYNGATDNADIKVAMHWEMSLATDYAGGGAPHKQIQYFPVPNANVDTPHGRGVANDDSNRYGWGYTYMWGNAQKDQAFYSMWDGTVTASNCEYCRENGYPTPACTGYKTCDEANIFEDIYPWAFRSLGCATGPTAEGDFFRYGVAPSGAFYRTFAKGYVACNWEPSASLDITLPAAPEGMWCTDLAGIERTGGQDQDCNGSKGGTDNVVADYDGGTAGGLGFSGVQTIPPKECIILYDSGSTQPDCTLLPEWSYTYGAAVPAPDPEQDPGVTTQGTILLGATVD